MIGGRRELLVGILTALVSTMILGGSLVAAIAEDPATIAQMAAPSNTRSPTPLPTTRPGDPTYTPSPTALPTETATSPPTSTTCPVPSGWHEITIRSGDTLKSLAAAYDTSAEEIAEGNCLLSNHLPENTTLFVPQLAASATSTTVVTYKSPTPPPVIVCGPPPSGWILYTVKSGENLYRIGLAYGVSVGELQQANCLGNSTYIQAGQQIYVPNVATITATFTQTSTPTKTSTSAPPTSTATATTAATPTATSTTLPSATPSPTSSATLAPTATLTPTATNTLVPSATATASPLPSNTPTTSP